MKSKRREFLQAVGAGAAGFTLATPSPSSALERAGAPTATTPTARCCSSATTSPWWRPPTARCAASSCAAFTTSLACRTAPTPSGANRFMPPQKPKAWTDVFPALWWGNSAPQNMDNRYANRYASFRDRWNYDDVGEDCLRINVWTPAISDGRKRPVMFWIHGGGFTSGNAIEQDGYSGENFARLGDVVFCSINHRLGPLGFTNLAGAAGERFAASGNVGMLDIVAALEWVRDNIARFGGDPGNVTIMGQSGGGAKVCALTAMPVRHRALSQGGRAERRVAQDGRSRVRGEARRVRAEGSRPDGRGHRQAAGDALEGLPTPSPRRRSRSSPPRPPGLAAGLRRGFNPFVDGKDLPQHPYSPAAAPTAAAGPDDDLLDLPGAVRELGRFDAREHHHGPGGRAAEAAGRVRPGVRRQGARGRGFVREGVPGQEAGRDLDARQQQPSERGGPRRRRSPPSRPACTSPGSAGSRRCSTAACAHSTAWISASGTPTRISC